MTSPDRTSRSLQRALGHSSGGSGGNTGMAFGLSRALLVASALVAVIAVCVGVGALTRPAHVRPVGDPQPLAASSSAGPSPAPTPGVTTRWRTKIIRVPVPGGTETRTVYVRVPGPGSTVTETRTVTAPAPAAHPAAAKAARSTTAARRAAAAPAARSSSTAGRRLAQRLTVQRNVTHQVTGWGCYAKDSAFFEDGRYEDRDHPENGWMWHNSGGGACNGGFDSMPMSGGWGDSGRDARFQFSVTPGTTTCSAATWVPDTADIRAAGGNPTGYDFVDSWDFNAGKHLKLSGVDEQANRGRWVDLGTVTTTTGKLMLFEHGNGFPYDQNRTPTWRHHSVTQVKLTCWQ